MKKGDERGLKVEKRKDLPVSVKQSIGTSREKYYPSFKLLIIVIASVFTTHAAIMILIPKPESLSFLMKVLLDASLMTLVVFPMLYFFLLRPLILHKSMTERAEKALRDYEDKYSIIFEESKDAIFVTTPEGKAIDINPAGVELFGYSSKEELLKVDIGQDIYVNPKDREKFLQIIEKQGFAKDYELVLKRKNGEHITVLVTANALHNEKGDVIAYRGIIRDVTEQRRLERQLLQSQKMEAIGKLAGGIAHDFNNLLTIIQGYTSQMMMDIEKSDPLYSNLHQIHLASTRAADLTRQLLLFSRKHLMNFNPFNINLMIENLLKMLKRMIGEDIDIKIDLQPDPWMVHGDEGQIEQVIMNLAVNARDAMPNRGTLTIKTENIYVDEAYCKRYSYARVGRFVRLTVADTGVGIEENNLSRIFEPFFTTKGNGMGTGLGLPVVYGIVKQHKGWINVQSKPGHGTTFSLYFPASSLEPEYKTLEEEASIKEFQGNGERILLVEDEAGVRGLATRTLRENGYKVFEASNSKEALDIFEKQKGDFQLVFSDVVLPDTIGLQLIDQLLNKKPQLRILLTSGYTDHKSQWPVIRERGYPFLQKPYAIIDLLKAVNYALKQNKES